MSHTRRRPTGEAAARNMGASSSSPAPQTLAAAIITSYNKPAPARKLSSHPISMYSKRQAALVSIDQALVAAQEESIVQIAATSGGIRLELSSMESDARAYMGEKEKIGLARQEKLADN